MKIFITGATGYLGYHIACQCLSEGHQVLCLRRTTSKSLFDEEKEQRIQWVTINEEDWEKQLNTLIIEIVGLGNIFSEVPQFLQLLAKLQGLLAVETPFGVYRKTIFECISLLRGCFNEKTC